MIVLDHSEPNWLRRYQRTNGALTYSKDLIKYQIPNWEKVLGENDIISTCAKFSECTTRGNFNLAIQYLHSYPYIGALDRIRFLANHLPFKAKRLIFITAYKAFERELIGAGFRAVYIPMAIDVNTIQQYGENKKYDDHRIIYFGNIVQNKVGVFTKIKKECSRLGLTLDVISQSRFNNLTPIDQEAALECVSGYQYGIGVGRCAQEMMALGLKVVIAGQKFGGIMTNGGEYTKQLETNMNGRICTYSTIPSVCFQNVGRSITASNDISTTNHATIFQANLTTT